MTATHLTFRDDAVAEDPLVALSRTVRAQGLAVLAEARWPEPGDGAPPPLPGFILSSFNPLVAAVARRCLSRRPDPAATPTRTAVVLASRCGDVTSAVHVASLVDSGTRVGPLFFFQSVPNAVAGYVAAREGLTGPVVCTSPARDGLADALAEAELLIADGDADEALVVLAEQAGAADPALAALVDRAGRAAGATGPDRAFAALVTRAGPVRPPADESGGTR